MWDAVKVLAVTGLLGLIARPLLPALLRGLPGLGAGALAPFGLLLCGWVAWLAVSLGLVRHGAGTAWVAVAVGGAGSLVVAGRRARRTGRDDATSSPDTPTDRALRRGALAVTAVGFLAATTLTAFAPDIVGTEKPMDMMLLQTSMTSAELPPRDLWLAGEDLNYYYLGSWLVGFVMLLADVTPDRGYTLGVGLVFGLGAGALFGLAGALAAATGARRPRTAVLAGLAATGLTMTAGTVEGARLVLAHDGPLRTLDWFAASRVTPGGADDSPFFATLLGDLHAHLIAAPFTLLALLFALHAATVGPWAGGRRITSARLAAVALATGVLAAMHTWTTPVVLALLLAAALARTWRDPARDGGGGSRHLAWWALVVALGVLAWAPFHLDFEPSPGGVGLVGDPPGPLAFLGRVGLTHGVLVGIALAAAALTGLAARRHRDASPPESPGAQPADRAIAARARRFTWLLVAAGLGCLLLPQVVYVKDAFDGGENFRFNTVFKFGFQAWPLLGAASGALLLALWRATSERGRPFVVTGVAAAALVSAVYPLAAPVARTGGFDGPARLGGLRWLERSAPGDVAAIRWIRAHLPRDAVVLEAEGPEYSIAGRIATFSGRATVIAWAGHEVVWGQPIGTREADVAAIYGSGDPSRVRALLARYRVDHVVIGAVERERYPASGLRVLARVAPRRVTVRGTAIHRVPRRDRLTGS